MNGNPRACMCNTQCIVTYGAVGIMRSGALHSFSTNICIWRVFFATQGIRQLDVQFVYLYCCF